MRFKLDENLPKEAVDLLRTAGHDAMSVVDQGLGGAPDDRIASVCAEERRVLLTFDLDFANIRAYPPSESCGLVVFRLRSQDKTLLMEVLTRLLGVLAEVSPEGGLWIVDQDRIRIRD